MSDSKAKRLIIASTVGAVLLVVILLFVMVYQMISISVEKKRKAELESRIAECNRLIAEGINEKQARSEKEWIIYEARKLGYILQGDTNLG